MPTYTQENRPVRIQTPFGENVLLIKSLNGRESLGRGFHYELELLSEEHELDYKKIIGQNVRTQVIPAEIINPIPGMRTMVPRTSMGRFKSWPALRRRNIPPPSRTRTMPIWRGVRTRATALGICCSGSEAYGNGRGLKEAPAGLSAHVGGQFLGGTELLDEAAVDFALELEDAGPAAVLEELADEPDERAEEAGEGRRAGNGPDDVQNVWVSFAGPSTFRPDGALERLSGRPARGSRWVKR